MRTKQNIVALAILLIVSCGSRAALWQDGQEVAAYTQDAINPTLDELDPPAQLETPQSAMEFFMVACEAQEFSRAAHALNLRLLPDISPDEATELARRLYFVINQELWIDWESLPDRPDGMDDGAPLNGSDPMVGQPRKSISIGSIDLEGRDAVIRLQRVIEKGDGATPRWLLSPFTVENIDAMYDLYGPGWLDRNMPEWAQARGWGRTMIWQWLAMLLTVLVAPALAYAATRIFKLVLRKGPWPRIGLYDALHGPLTFFIMAVSISLVFGTVMSLPGRVAAIFDPVMLLFVAGTGAWVVMRVMNFVIEHVAKRAIRHSHQDNEDEQQSILTSITILRHVLVLVIAAIALGIALAQLDGFRSIGVALLSSAGAIALIVGIAGHAVLGNVIAGLQIAFTQPFTLGDSVYVEDNYGTIEDITYTYVIVRTWDYRRLVIPVRHFVDNWFENWSMRDGFLTKPIYLHLDYSANIQTIREKFLEFVKEDDDWASEDDDPKALAYEAKEESLIVRLTCAAKDPGTAWSLHCRIREKMVTWLQEVEDGRWLPRQRIDLGQVDSKLANQANPGQSEEDESLEE